MVLGRAGFCVIALSGTAGCRRRPAGCGIVMSIGLRRAQIRARRAGGLISGPLPTTSTASFSGMNVLFGDRGHVGQRHLLERGAVGLKIIGGIAVELEPFALGEDLVAGVVAEEERVEDVVLGALELGLGEGLGVEAGDLGFGRLGGVDGGGALGEHFHAEGAGMVVVQTEAAADRVGEAQLRAHLLKEPAAESAAENLVHDDNGRHVGIVAVDAEADDLHVRLIHVFLVDEVDAGLGAGERIVARRLGSDGRQTFEDRAHLGFHGRGIEVAADADDELALQRAVVPGLQVGKRDGADGGELRLARVGAVDAVDQLGRFALGDSVLIVVAAHDGRGFLLLGELQFFRAEFGMKQQVHGQRKDLVGVAFQRIPGERGGIVVAVGLNVRGLGFEQIVHGVAVHLRGSAGAPCLAVEADEAGLGGIFVARAAGNEHRAGDERQLVVFLQEDDDAVLELDALGLLRMKGVQRRNGDLLPGLGLLGGEAGEKRTRMRVRAIAVSDAVWRPHNSRQETGLPWPGTDP